MNKLDRYIGSNVAMMISLASAGLISLFLVFTFLDQVGDIEGNYTLVTVLHFVGLSIPRMFYETLPYAVLIGCLSGLGLLASNSELIVMRAAGVSTWRIARATLNPALVFVAIGLLVGETVLPDVERAARVVRENAMEDDITPQGGFWYREGDIYTHTTTVSHTGELRDINQYTVSNDQGTDPATLGGESPLFGRRGLVARQCGDHAAWQRKNRSETVSGHLENESDATDTQYGNPGGT